MEDAPATALDHARCANCDERAPWWRPAYSPMQPVFCTQRCAAEYAHELVAEQAEADHKEPSMTWNDEQGFGESALRRKRFAESHKRLAETGSVYCTRAATHQYQEARGIDGPEEARRELTEYLLDATRSADGTWRIRRRSLGVDLIVRVAHEDGLAVVVSLVSARDYAAITAALPDSPRRGKKER